jgi:hypothetical protein
MAAESLEISPDRHALARESATFLVEIRSLLTGGEPHRFPHPLQSHYPKSSIINHQSKILLIPVLRSGLDGRGAAKPASADGSDAFLGKATFKQSNKCGGKQPN